MAESSITLQLSDPDSIRCLRRALENGALSFESMAATARVAAAAQTAGGDRKAAERAERRAREYDRRAVLTAQLVDQLPPNVPPMYGPSGDA